MKTNISIIHNARNNLYNYLRKEKLLAIVQDKYGLCATVADKGSKQSRELSLAVFRKLNASSLPKKVNGQTAGKTFEISIQKFLEETFPKLQNLRPGTWYIKDLGNKNHIKLSQFSQYYHLKHLMDMAKGDPELAAALGNDYTIAPDVIIARGLYTDDEINSQQFVVDNETSTCADLRENQSNKPDILHASISVKWTMRTDRAQNTRTEALNLIRNRKGHLPHIVAVTAECMPNRLESLALGTGDIDCVYHIALYELRDVIYDYAKKNQAPELKETIDMLINGHRLKDISDLPLDLCV